jgi:hypothetical protein
MRRGHGMTVCWGLIEKRNSLEATTASPTCCIASTETRSYSFRNRFREVNMALQAFIVTSPETQPVEVGDRTVVPVLGPNEDAVAVRIDEVVRAIADSVCDTITEESDLFVEITGNISLKGSAGAKWLFFNVGGSVAKTDALKVTLKTKIRPRKTP